MFELSYFTFYITKILRIAGDMEDFSYTDEPVSKAE